MMNDNEEKQEILLDEMLKILSKENEAKLPEDLDLQDKIWLLDNLMIMRTCGDLREDFLALQDKYLMKKNSSWLENVSKLKYKKNIAYYTESILKLNADMILIFSSNIFVDMKVKDCIDNELILHGGLQIKEELYNQLREEKNISLDSPYIINSYNLFSKKISKIIIPNNSINNFNNTKNAIQELIMYIKENKYKSLAIAFGGEVRDDEIMKNILNEINSSIKNAKYKIKLIIQKN